MPKKTTPISCDWKTVASRKSGIKSATNKSRFYRHKGSFTWQGIKIEKYKSNGKDWSGIVRYTLIGNHGETTRFHLRYFEVAPGGHSSFEMHKHEHVVICVRGKGKVKVEKKSYAINFMDTFYIAPNTPHQLRNPFKKPLGFFCIVNAKRDKPIILNR
ncbi:MAG: cupin domain-containing protein [Nitrospirae bacterium]|nr:cupin domain-containing protein [Nitrospirota bacterium]